MLNLTNNRLNYGDILLGPNNYHLDFAIGTTYSLDLDSLVGVSLALLSGEIDSDMLNNKVLLLDSLIKNTGKIDLFCENGQIHTPKNPNPLHILLEKIVFQVTNNNFSEHSKFASFHPKFWLLRFIDDNDKVLYRVIVLSRNLTFDRSWDISFVIDGKIGEKTTKNNALIYFINELYDLNGKNAIKTDEIISEEKAKKINNIIEDLEYVQFSLNDSFNDYEFIINNGTNDEYFIQKELLFKEEHLDNLLIISPFLSNTVIKKFNDKINSNSKAILITQADSLLELSCEDCSNFDVYTVRQEIIDGETYLPKDAQYVSNQDVHAKIYLAQHENCSELYLGSLNASCNALKSNVEFMVKLSASSDEVNVKKISESLFDVDGENPFEKVDWSKINNKKENKDNDFSDKIKYLVRLESKVIVISCENYYNIELEFKDLDMDKFNDLDVTIQPLFVKKSYKLNNILIFKNLDKKKLSEFFIVTINKKFKRVIKIPTEGMPDDRFDEVISSIINNDTDFLLYVSYLLGDEFVFDDFDFEGDGDSLAIGQYNVQLPELYEKMLKASYYNPDKFDEIDVLINSLSEDNMIDCFNEFKELYDTFKEVL